MSDLDACLLAAHAAEDKPALAALYEEAADTAGDKDARAFYLTQAYVFALDAALPRAARLRQRLVAMGRERD